MSPSRTPLCYLLSFVYMIRSIVYSLTHQQQAIIVHGQRCVLHQETVAPNYPPLVLLVGTAQTAASWSALHMAAFARQKRSVLIYEPLGLGLQSTPPQDVSIPKQVEHLWRTVETVFGETTTDTTTTITTIDMVGFSLGGRIALAAVAAPESPFAVRRLHLTGVALRRSHDNNNVWLDGWKNRLKANDMEGFARAVIESSYNTKDVPRPWIDGVCRHHRPEGLLALLEQAHNDDDSSVENTVRQFQQQHTTTATTTGRILVGSEDILSPPEQACALAEELGWPTATILPGLAHAVPFQSPREWRSHALAFLNE